MPSPMKELRSDRALEPGETGAIGTDEFAVMDADENDKGDQQERSQTRNPIGGKRGIRSRMPVKVSAIPKRTAANTLRDSGTLAQAGQTDCGVG